VPCKHRRLSKLRGLFTCLLQCVLQKPSDVFAIYKCRGWCSLGKGRGTNARKPEPRKWPAWKAGEGLPRLTVFPKGWRSWAVLRGCGFGEMPETRAGKSPGFPEVVKRAELCGVLTGGKGRRDKTGKAQSFRKRDIFGMFYTAITCAGNPQGGRQRLTLTANSKISYAVS